MFDLTCVSLFVVSLVQEAKSILTEVTRLASSVDSPRVVEAQLGFDVSPRKAAARRRRDDHSDADSGVVSLVKGTISFIGDYEREKFLLFE